MKPRLVLGFGLLVLIAGGCGASTATPSAVDDALIRSAFGVCTDQIHVGQSSSVAGVTCNDVCRVFGFSSCEYRAGQSGYALCTPADPSRSGACEDVFKQDWSSQCLCKR